MVKATVLTSDFLNSGSNDIGLHNTDSISPKAHRPVLVAIGQGRGVSDTPNLPLVSGCNLTFTLVDTFIQAPTRKRITLYRGISDNPTVGVLQLSNTDNQLVQNLNWGVVQFQNVNQDTPVIQVNKAGGWPVTSVTVSMSPFVKASNALFGVAYKNNGASFGNDSGFTELYDEDNQQQAQFKASQDTGVEFSGAGGETMIAIAVELNHKRKKGGAALLDLL